MGGENENEIKHTGRKMRSLIRTGCAAVMIWAGFTGPACASEASAVRTINIVELATGDTGLLSTFYVSTDTGWGASGCPSAPWAYFYSDRTNAKELFALLLWAKQLGKQVQLVGTCTSADYFNLVQVAVL